MLWPIFNFGAWALLSSSFNPFYLAFIVPGILCDGRLDPLFVFVAAPGHLGIWASGVLSLKP
ncbi:MAG: hypothetical protein IPL01_24705 [Acidobacteria bacterium]|nr:hypothetical protein [Acidobacteriota bacterium]